MYKIKSIIYLWENLLTRVFSFFLFTFRVLNTTCSFIPLSPKCLMGSTLPSKTYHFLISLFDIDPSPLPPLLYQYVVRPTSRSSVRRDQTTSVCSRSLSFLSVPPWLSLWCNRSWFCTPLSRYSSTSVSSSPPLPYPSLLDLRDWHFSELWNINSHPTVLYRFSLILHFTYYLSPTFFQFIYSYALISHLIHHFSRQLTRQTWIWLTFGSLSLWSPTCIT